MQPFSWSEAEVLQSKADDHQKVERRYSLDNENFEYRAPLEILWALDDNSQRVEGATYYAADFALVEPECFDQVDEFLAKLGERFLEKYEHAQQVCFDDVDDSAKLALLRAVEGWIAEHVFVEPQWLRVGEATCLTVPTAELASGCAETLSSHSESARRTRLRRAKVVSARISNPRVALIKSRRMGRNA